jgi:hypothetical protein
VLNDTDLVSAGEYLQLHGGTGSEYASQSSEQWPNERYRPAIREAGNLNHLRQIGIYFAEGTVVRARPRDSRLRVPAELPTAAIQIPNRVLACADSPSNSRMMPISGYCSLALNGLDKIQKALDAHLRREYTPLI